MIIAHFKDIDNYKGLSENLDNALEYLKYVDMDTLEDGKTVISGEDVYSMVSTYNTREDDESKYEIHKKYIDIQCLISGEEIIYCSEKDDLQTINAYDEMTDKQNLSGGQDGVKIHLTPNRMAIFYPNDAHKACCKIDEIKSVRKLLLKVRI